MTKGTRSGKGSALPPGRSLPPGKTWYLLYRRLGGPQGRSGQVRKISPPTGFDPRVYGEDDRINGRAVLSGTMPRETHESRQSGRYWDSRLFNAKKTITVTEWHELCAQSSDVIHICCNASENLNENDSNQSDDTDIGLLQRGGHIT
jgi:hypothetical protein